MPITTSTVHALLLFVPTNLCELGFSTLMQMKTRNRKQRSPVTAELAANGVAEREKSKGKEEEKKREW